MRAFNVIRFQIVDEQRINEFLVREGIIIDKSPTTEGWLLEICIELDHQEYFQSLYEQGEQIDIRVMITRPTNDPALFSAKIVDFLELDDELSVIMDCKIHTQRQTYAEQLLKQLIDEGHTGEDLTKTFDRHMQSKPKLKEEHINSEEVE